MREENIANNGIVLAFRKNACVTTRPSNTTLNNTKRHLNNTVIYCHNSVATINDIAKWWFFQNFGKKWRFFQNFEFVLKFWKKNWQKIMIFSWQKMMIFFKISAKLKKSSILLKFWKKSSFFAKILKKSSFLNVIFVILNGLVKFFSNVVYCCLVLQHCRIVL